MLWVFLLGLQSHVDSFVLSLLLTRDVMSLGRNLQACIISQYELLFGGGFVLFFPFTDFEDVSLLIV